MSRVITHCSSLIAHRCSPSSRLVDSPLVLAPRPACGEREGRLRGRANDQMKRPSSALWAPSPRMRGEGRQNPESLIHSTGEEAAVDADDLAVDEGGGIRGEEHADAGELFDPA